MRGKKKKKIKLKVGILEKRQKGLWEEASWVGRGLEWLLGGPRGQNKLSPKTQTLINFSF